MQQVLYLITTTSLPSCITATDHVVLLHEAVYLIDSFTHPNLYALEDDLYARGLKDNNVKVIDYAHLVALTTQYNKVITWN